MSSSELKQYIESLASHIIFEYNGVSGGVDPINSSHFDLWYGDVAITANSIDEVMGTAIFNNKSLAEIANTLTIIDY